jgi:hypothetical protein
MTLPSMTATSWTCPAGVAAARFRRSSTLVWGCCSVPQTARDWLHASAMSGMSSGSRARITISVLLMALSSLRAMPEGQKKSPVRNRRGWWSTDLAADLAHDLAHRPGPGGGHKAYVRNPAHAASLSEAAHAVKRRASLAIRRGGVVRDRGAKRFAQVKNDGLRNFPDYSATARRIDSLLRVS